MATAYVASRPHEDRHHVQVKTDRPIGRGISHSDRSRGFVALIFDFQLRLTVGHGVKRVAFQSSVLTVRQLDRSLGGHVYGHAVAARRDDNELLVISTCVQVDVGRVDINARDRGTPGGTRKAQDNRSSE